MSSPGETTYRQLFEDPKARVITLAHLFDALNQIESQGLIDEVLDTPSPIRVLIEGSAFPRNIEIVNSWLQSRENSQDSINLIDISPKSATQHTEFIRNKNICNTEIIQGNMNALPFSDESVDVVINDCAINFNNCDSDNLQTLREIHRVLKRNSPSLAFVTIAVDRKYDQEDYGRDQELLPDELVDTPGEFMSFRTRSDGKIELMPETTRKCWPVKYYENLFKKSGFEFTKFDEAMGKTYFPKESGISYRRYLLRLDPNQTN